MLTLECISFQYSQQAPALHEVSLELKADDFMALAGHNGSGKTTLTRLIMGLIKPTGGRILLDDEDLARHSTAQRARHIGYVFQNPDRQIFRDTVALEVAYGPQQLGFSAAETSEAVAKALQAVSLADQAQADPRLLPKGLKQRVAIASALSMKPRLLILDEPTSGQDAWERRQLMSLLQGLHRQGMAILMITHDMELLAAHFKRVAVLGGGRKVFDGTVADLFSGAHDLQQWGLAEPSLLQLSRLLKQPGVSDAEVFCQQLLPLLKGGLRHE